MTDNTNQSPSSDDLGPLETPKKGGGAGLIVAVSLALLMIGGVFYLDRSKSDGRMIQPDDEEFRFRAARLPEPPRDRPFPTSDPNGAVVKPERTDVEDERDRREAEALAYAQMASQQAADAAARERELESKRVADAQRKKEQDRMRSPLLVDSGDTNRNGAAAGTDAAAQDATPGGGYQHGQFLDAFARASAGNANGPTPSGGNNGDQSDDEDQRAYAFVPGEPTQIASTSATLGLVDLATRVRQGKLIPGVLKTALNSDHPGMVTAVVQEDVYSDDGTQVLIPRGSDLIGEYRSGIKRGQSRVFIIWRRLARPDGVDVSLDSPGADQLGVAGLTGDVDSHFFQRFGAAMILSFIEAQSDDSSESTQIYASDLQRASEIALRDSINIPPTINVDQGTRISVIVARDLFFHRASLPSPGVPVASRGFGSR